MTKMNNDIPETIEEEIKKRKEEHMFFTIQFALAVFEDAGIYDVPIIKRFDTYPKVLMGRGLDLNLALIRYAYNHADGQQVLEEVYNICYDLVKDFLPDRTSSENEDQQEV